VRCRVEHAFTAFTQKVELWWPRGHRRFERSELQLQAEVGGRFFERADSGEEHEVGQVVICEPPHRIVYTWWPGAISKPTLVEVSFAQHGNETWVEVRHSEGDSELGDAWPTRVALFERGWQHVLTAFAEFASDQRAVR
jgi:uncharacterized protein YndB with AHSA1/START domain